MASSMRWAASPPLARAGTVATVTKPMNATAMRRMLPGLGRTVPTITRILAGDGKDLVAPATGALRGARLYSARMTASETLQLGQATSLPASPGDARLDRVPNPHADTDYVARFTAPEFTSICPVTGQPDFAILVIDYVPGDWLVESKSLKLYLGAFRNHGAFHEDCTVAIGKRLRDLLEPRYLRIGGYWYPRGGIPIDVFWQTGEPPKTIWLPETGVAPYRGR
jgi:7-cyano-7-deazaguanine reductase